MNVRNEINNYSSEDDKPILLWLFARYHREFEWRMMAHCTFQRYGTQSYQCNRVWIPTQVGRTLYAQDKVKEIRKSMCRSEFSASLVDDVIVIIDSDTAGTMSVTNDAESVVAEVVKRFGVYPIVYRDSAGTWDGLAHNDGVFTGFIALNAEDSDTAVQRIKKVKP